MATILCSNAAFVNNPHYLVKFALAFEHVPFGFKRAAPGQSAGPTNYCVTAPYSGAVRSGHKTPMNDKQFTEILDRLEKKEGPQASIQLPARGLFFV